TGDGIVGNVALGHRSVKGRDEHMPSTFDERDEDWRAGSIVYQVLVDRFFPPSPSRLEEKRSLYAPPRTLLEWNTTPQEGHFVEDMGVWSHELAFYGGDFESLLERLDHICEFASILYLNPIVHSPTYHKYGADDYHAINEEYGDWTQLQEFIQKAHERSLRMVFDFVPNHCGLRSAWFQEAKASKTSPFREFFFFDEQDRARGWADVSALPELNLDSEKVRSALFHGEDAVLRRYLRAGFDGARVDVAFDVGFHNLRRISQVVREERGKQGLVIGEINAHPARYLSVVDGVLQYYVLGLLLEWTRGGIGNARLGRLLQRMVDEVGIDALLRCWLMLENHDTPRLMDRIPDRTQRHALALLTFSLPGCVCLYYGVELGMTGEKDPYNRAAMRWDLCTDTNEELQFYRKLVALRKEKRALRVGDFVRLDTEHVLAFLRRTRRWRETLVILANGSNTPVQEVVCLEDPMLMQYLELLPLFSIHERSMEPIVIGPAGTISITLAPHDVVILGLKLPPRFSGMSPSGAYEVARRAR
ncbi:MAG TPA: alpha-amylase family glycosyl hydrolase, partial [Polyangiaceae bacterium]|nr:alpha-amylase family glycosyl hydrolase [Polyangiaceae bacterium]